MAEILQLTVNVHGLVQGVCFRDFVRRTAAKLNLQGYVRNLPCGDIVEIKAVGEKHCLESLVSNLRKGTAGSIVQNIELTWSDQVNHFDDFTIRY